MLALGAILLLPIFFAVPIAAAPLGSRIRSFIDLFARADTCSGNAALCDRKYSEVTFIGTHDSAFVGLLPTQNQIKSITDQLNGGIRYLQSQTHKDDNQLKMCHTSCDLEDAGPVEDYLREVKTWMDKNPRDVITLLLTNADRVPMSTFDDVFKKVGLDQMAFKPASSPLAMDAWPTMGDLIGSGKRLVTFIDYGADEKAVPYLLDEFNYYFETPYGVTDSKFAQCKIDRANKVNADGKASMFIVNHMLNVELPFNIIVPDRVNAGKTNAASSISAQSDLCKGLYGRNPNVILLDFFGQGDPMPAQIKMNGL
ncbi:hypothetical protein FKW77_003015 [Venturia effusa]|uniref:Phosphatidylinositol-specific phospholipase C X domain-containing protein n=1 Tax=Venturia effusa TaxID=50376 RepID=A0A517L2W9_9PEZI|nr:hypothetical protein FKW77_003015 [Venturia effusa]